MICTHWVHTHRLKPHADDMLTPSARVATAHGRVEEFFRTREVPLYSSYTIDRGKLARTEHRKHTLLL